MKDSKDEQARLELMVSRWLSAQPLRRAPPTMASQVLAQLEHRAALPWWRHSFLRWPVAARIGFLLLAIGATKLVLVMNQWGITRLDLVKASAAPEMNWLHTLTGALSGTGNLLMLVVNSFSTTWLYGAGIVLAAMYVALFGLGATAYRTLYSNS
jgi:hypothetical protein